jgi:hypothetical protein
MKPLFRSILYVVVLLIGIFLMVEGIVTEKHGATVIGLICAAVSTQQWMQWRKQFSKEKKKPGIS